ncbi:MAG: hypothetical protein H8E44_18105 [Planctomycetes bacterium]|nr:hypothetical protein [Planctomycetota bacterium]MBL7039558.1 hypothetical protein [Pirellulaceae bacterium]
MLSRRVVAELLLFAFAMTKPLFAEESQERRSAGEVGIVVLDSGIAEADVEKKPYADYVTECVDLLMEYGTDRYGKRHKPVLVTILDVRSRACPESPPEQTAHWRGQWRPCFWKPRGADLLVDQSTVEVFYLLSQITENRKYSVFADRYLRCVTESVDEKGFFWWGWHRFYDVFADQMSGSHGNCHEIHVNLPRWERLWRVDEEATRRELEAIWQWHVVDKTTGEFNRHGDGRRGCDFAMSGAEFIYAFSFLYTKTKDPVWLERADLVANYLWQSRDRKTNLIPNRPNAGRTRFDGGHLDTSVTGLLCYYLLKSYELTNAEVFRNQAVAYLAAYDRYGYDPSTKCFWGSLTLDGKPVPGPRVQGGYEQYEPRGHIDLWEPYQLGYEFPIYTAQAYAYAFQVTGDRKLLDAATRWADWIRRCPPSEGCLAENAWYERYAELFAQHGTFADMYGRTISLFVHLYALTGEQSYLNDARRTARESVSRLYYKGLLRGHPAKPYYSSVDGVGYLLYALLQLDRVLEKPDAAVGAKAIPLGNSRGTIGFDNW